ncbi:MAG: sulfotransferase, partial [Planctomycetota bacterium]
MADWRWNLLHALGPCGYPGFLVSDWFRLLRENQFAVSPSHMIRAASASASVVANSAIALAERIRFGTAVEKTDVTAPLFVLGHWRSGTTHLHKLLSLDDRFAFPNLYQVSWPHTFLSTEAASTCLTRAFLPHQRPFDNVQQSWAMPNEDELAIATLTLRSPYIGGLFPQKVEHYDRYL